MILVVLETLELGHTGSKCFNNAAGNQKAGWQTEAHVTMVLQIQFVLQ